MDSNDDAALAIIKTHRLTVWLVVLTVVLVVLTVLAVALMAWPLLYPPEASQVPPSGQGDAFMVKGWAPIILLGSCLVLSTILLFIVAFRRWKNKRLTAEISNLTTDVINLKHERQQAWDKVKEANNDALEANRIAKHEKGQNEILDKLHKDAESQLANWAWLHRLA